MADIFEISRFVIGVELPYKANVVRAVPYVTKHGCFKNIH